MIFGALFVCVFCCSFQAKSTHEKLCLDCAGVGGLHVRPPRGIYVFTLFVLISDFCFTMLLCIDFSSILVPFWEGFWHHLGSILAPFGGKKALRERTEK